VPNAKIEQDSLWFHRTGEELKEEVAVLAAQLAELEQRNLRSSALIRKLGEFFGFGAAGRLDWARFKLNFKREELDRFEAQPEMLKVADDQCDTVPELPSKYSTTRNLLKGKKMAETHFTDITIVGNSISRLPRREGKNKDGKDQFIITFSLSSSASGLWIETFNRVWKKRGEQTHLLQSPIVKDNQIQIICSLDDQLQGHLEDLKREAATTNQVYREQLRTIDEERSNNDEILQKLRF
jgi:hypothetical protein